MILHHAWPPLNSFQVWVVAASFPSCLVRAYKSSTGAGTPEDWGGMRLERRSAFLGTNWLWPTAKVSLTVAVG